MLQFELPDQFQTELTNSLRTVYREAIEQAQRDCAVTRELLTTDEASEMYSVSRNTITEKWHKEKGLPLYKVGNKLYVDRKEMNDFIKAHPYQ
ncbi:helix-turn-helix domain-containing protein [Aerococcus sp. UMB7834]|uniref:helix-turn-helix domain-containing protein n=1 Tax=Aerococcus sp. UMB7834 TaxID=3046342 RepID=UPI00254A332F|nr:helix-turn-helix domain-containing protein [Aerococcus sp. UMB7834]MDK6804243.1 helix-turn-helix domain-containing protein [Aerococcus sp. UMB7834]